LISQIFINPPTNQKKTPYPEERIGRIRKNSRARQHTSHSTKRKKKRQQMEGGKYSKPNEKVQPRASKKAVEGTKTGKETSSCLSFVVAITTRAERGSTKKRSRQKSQPEESIHRNHLRIVRELLKQKKG